MCALRCVPGKRCPPVWRSCKRAWASASVISNVSTVKNGDPLAMPPARLRVLTEDARQRALAWLRE
jgi:hypothetical protein